MNGDVFWDCLYCISLLCEFCLLVKLMWIPVLDVDMKMVALYSVDSHKEEKNNNINL